MMGLVASAHVVSGGGTTFTDSFDRANAATLGAGWLHDASAWTIASNKAVRGTSGSDFAVFLTTMGKADMFCEADVTVVSGNFCVVNARRDNVNSLNGYLAFPDPAGSQIVLAKEIGGNYTELARGGSYSGSGRVRIEVQGSAIRGYWNGSLQVSATDSGVTTGNYAGLNANSTGTCTYDNFACGPL